MANSSSTPGGGGTKISRGLEVPVGSPRRLEVWVATETLKHQTENAQIPAVLPPFLDAKTAKIRDGAVSWPTRVGRGGLYPTTSSQA